MVSVSFFDCGYVVRDGEKFSVRLPEELRDRFLSCEFYYCYGSWKRWSKSKSEYLDVRSPNWLLNAPISNRHVGFHVTFC